MAEPIPMVCPKCGFELNYIGEPGAGFPPICEDCRDDEGRHVKMVLRKRSSSSMLATPTKGEDLVLGRCGVPVVFTEPYGGAEEVLGSAQDVMAKAETDPIQSHRHFVAMTSTPPSPMGMRFDPGPVLGKATDVRIEDGMLKATITRTTPVEGTPSLMDGLCSYSDDGGVTCHTNTPVYVATIWTDGRPFPRETVLEQRVTILERQLSAMDKVVADLLGQVLNLEDKLADRKRITIESLKASAEDTDFAKMMADFEVWRSMLKGGNNYDNR